MITIRERKIKYGDDDFKTKQIQHSVDYTTLEKSLNYKFPELSLRRFLRKYSTTFFLIYSNYHYLFIYLCIIFYYLFLFK